MLGVKQRFWKKKLLVKEKFSSKENFLSLKKSFVEGPTQKNKNSRVKTDRIKLKLLVNHTYQVFSFKARARLSLVTTLKNKLHAYCALCIPIPCFVLSTLSFTCSPLLITSSCLSFISCSRLFITALGLSTIAEEVVGPGLAKELTEAGSLCMLSFGLLLRELVADAAVDISGDTSGTAGSLGSEGNNLGLEKTWAT